MRAYPLADEASPEYFMHCSECSEKDVFTDLSHAYANGWSTHHCPEHNTGEYHDYNMECCVCRFQGVFIDLDDAIENGWWTLNEFDFCPEHMECAL